MIDNDIAGVIAERLKVNNTLNELCLSGNSIRSIGLRKLEDALKDNSTLQSLDLGLSLLK